MLSNGQDHDLIKSFINNRPRLYIFKKISNSDDSTNKCSLYEDAKKFKEDKIKFNLNVTHKNNFLEFINDNFNNYLKNDFSYSNRILSC